MFGPAEICSHRHRPFPSPLHRTHWQLQEPTPHPLSSSSWFLFRSFGKFARRTQKIRLVVRNFGLRKVRLFLFAAAANDSSARVSRKQHFSSATLAYSRALACRQTVTCFIRSLRDSRAEQRRKNSPPKDMLLLIARRAPMSSIRNISTHLGDDILSQTRLVAQQHIHS